MVKENTFHQSNVSLSEISGKRLVMSKNGLDLNLYETARILLHRH